MDRTERIVGGDMDTRFHPRTKRILHCDDGRPRGRVFNVGFGIFVDDGQGYPA